MAGQEPSRYMRLDRTVVERQMIHRTGQNPSHVIEGKTTHGFKVQTYGQRAVVIRWIGPVENENKNLNRYTQALQRDGYVVRRMTEINLEPKNKAQQEQQKERKNREVLHAQKLKPEYQKKKPEIRRQSSEVHTR